MKSHELWEDDFKALYNFMIVFYKILMYYRLLPYWGEAFGEFKGLGFDRVPLTDFSYKKQIMKSQFMHEFREDIGGEHFPYLGDSPYAVAQSICIRCPRYRDSHKFEELLTYIDGMIRYKLLIYEDIPADEIDDCGNIVGWNTFRRYDIDR